MLQIEIKEKKLYFVYLDFSDVIFVNYFYLLVSLMIFVIVFFLMGYCYIVIYCIYIGNCFNVICFVIDFSI